MGDINSNKNPNIGIDFQSLYPSVVSPNGSVDVQVPIIPNLESVDDDLDLSSSSSSEENYPVEPSNYHLEEDSSSESSSEIEVPSLAMPKIAKKYHDQHIEIDMDKIKEIEVTTDGITYDEYKVIPFIQRKKLIIQQCTTCQKFYPEYMVPPYDEMQMCWHCMIWLNSDEQGRKNIEEFYNLSTQKYVEMCGPRHDKNKCVRKADCLLCNNYIDESNEASESEDSPTDNKKEDFNVNKVKFTISL